MAALMYPASMLPLLLFQNSAAMLGPGMRHTLRMNKLSLPILYNPEAADVSVEHVVPLSVLRKEGASLLDDPYNMHLSASRYNSIRSNYRFWFTSEPDRESHMEAVGHGNYVSHRYKMFTPPRETGPRFSGPSCTATTPTALRMTRYSLAGNPEAVNWLHSTDHRSAAKTYSMPFLPPRFRHSLKALTRNERVYLARIKCFNPAPARVRTR